MKITYYGHSCFSASLQDKTLLFDPFISPNPRASHIRVDQITADYILLSHAHEDHVADVVPIAKRTNATVLCAFEIYLWLNKQGVTNCHPMNHGGTAHLPFGSAKMVNAIHSSSLPDGSYGGNPAGWIIQSPQGNFYYSGDTALTMDMKIIGETTPLQFAALCIGDTFTMGVQDAIQAANWTGAKHVLGLHYDTFPPIQINPQEAQQAFLKAGKTLHLPGIGQTVDL